MLTTESKPKVTNWFSSLRRQPKPKKNDKKLQQSCVDLTTTASLSLVTPKSISPAISSTSTNNYDPVHIGTTTSLYSGASTASISSENEKNLCSKCSRIKIRNEKKLSIKSPLSINRTISTTSSTAKILLSSDSDKTNEFFTEEIIKTPTNNQTVYYFNKQEKLSTTAKVTTKTTTTITRTTTFLNKKMNRSGLVFDENGEILTNLENSRKFILNHLTNTNNNNSFSSKPDILLLSLGNADTLNNNNNNNEDDCNDENIYDDVINDVINDEYNDDFEYIDDDDCIDEIYNRDYRPKLCSNCKIKMKSQSEWNISNKKQVKDELCDVVSEMEALDGLDDCKNTNSKDKQMSIGRKKFNMDPKKGIEYLVENHLLRINAQDVADFLYKGEGLNKTAIGDYLGEKNDFNENVLKAFVELHDFTNLILVQALRQFLWSFRLPGEAQKIDRMMECFAQRYCILNPNIFTNTDTCYVLSFAIIMLNTSLHNPSVKDKPSIEQFISMNRGINNGGDLPRELLESLYDSIKTEPFKIPQDDGNDLMHTFFNPDKEGWLWKQGGRYKSWKRRWFILNDNCLYYFEYTTDKEPRGIIPLENISVREITDRNKPHCFELFACGGADIIKACKTDSEGKVVEGKHTVYRMSSATEEDKQDWMKCLTVSISHNPFYDILVQRKKKALVKS